MASPGRGCLRRGAACPEGTGRPRNQAEKKPFGAMPRDVILVLLVGRVSLPFQTHPLTGASPKKNPTASVCSSRPRKARALGPCGQLVYFANAGCRDPGAGSQPGPNRPAPVTCVRFFCGPAYVLHLEGASPVPPAGIQPGSIASGPHFGRAPEAAGTRGLARLRLSGRLGTAVGVRHPRPGFP